MAKRQFRGKELIKMGFPENRIMGIALEIVNKKLKKQSRVYCADLLEKVLAQPETYEQDEVWQPLAAAILEEKRRGAVVEQFKLTPGKEFPIYGEEGIDQGARHQMFDAMKLPITRAGALMPDAHYGYGLPIGGVLATEGAVIPYGVGVDIGCRMAITLYDQPQEYLQRHHHQLKQYLADNTRFGLGANGEFKKPMDHEILDRGEFKDIGVVKHLKDKAWKQLGSSGGGNHFVEWGMVELTDPYNEWKLPPGQYLALLSHSGSRGMGAFIAATYTKQAKQACHLPDKIKHLSWLDLSTEAGQEYWAAMNLAGDYAKACHDQIHRRMAKSLGMKPLAKVENHHNFAWKEFHDGKELVVHRKGATPAGPGVLGIIPGSMTAPGFIVRGKGNPESLHSASHGAGRQMSRRQAKDTYTEHHMRKMLEANGIDLIGGGVDEAPMVYKDIHQVMDHQQELVEVVGTFTPRIVRMEGGPQPRPGSFLAEAND